MLPAYLCLRPTPSGQPYDLRSSGLDTHVFAVQHKSMEMEVYRRSANGMCDSEITEIHVTHLPRMTF